MKLDLNDLNPGTWFDFPDGEGAICLKALAYEDASKLRKETTKKKAEYKGEYRYAFDETDEDKLTEDVWDRTIIDWKDLYSADGKSIACTREMKIQLMSKSPVFATMVRGFLEKLADAEKVQAEIEEKN